MQFGHQGGIELCLMGARMCMHDIKLCLGTAHVLYCDEYHLLHQSGFSLSLCLDDWPIHLCVEHLARVQQQYIQTQADSSFHNEHTHMTPFQLIGLHAVVLARPRQERQASLLI